MEQLDLEVIQVPYVPDVPGEARESDTSWLLGQSRTLSL
jgi:hypothetical protein